MRLKVYSTVIFIMMALPLVGQYRLSGIVKDADLGKPIPDAEVFDKSADKLVRTNSKGQFEFEGLATGEHRLVIFVMGYNPKEQIVNMTTDQSIEISLEPFGQELSEVVINQKREEIFRLNRLNPVEGTAIYAGKKSEVVLVDQMVGNMAANNARQIYSQVVGLNIYENNDAGLQLNIGGRGLDPNRTSNFNTRQNGYDISADVLGYPESYYTPPAEALSEIQVIRGAASLQYGTQFGGLINFKLKKPNPVKKIEWTSRQTIGSFGLFTSFNSLSGKVGKLSYYTYFNYKQGDGFRPNSNFDSKNYYGYVNYAISENTDISAEVSYLNYLAKQPGGLTDSQFAIDPYFSNRDRNYFAVDWKLYALNLKHQFSTKTDFSLNVFGLDAQRSALGFRGDAQRPERNPITEPDDPDFYPRDLIIGNFNNWGFESRLLTRYNYFGNDAAFLIGVKYYNANNDGLQGAASTSYGPNFTLDSDATSYPNQSRFEFPNDNIALFAENVVFINNRLSITPGIRVEHIKTESKGSYVETRYDNAGNLIFRNDTTDNRVFNRRIVLLGIGASYNFNSDFEGYANISQNYRSVTFSDIRVVNPTFIIDPNISDENGYTADIGFRGKLKDQLSFDASLFALKYNDRLGTVLVSSGPNKGDRVRQNIGDAMIFGIETFVDWNLAKTLGMDNSKYRLNPFVNLALTESTYLNSAENNVAGKKVEFIPVINLKTGLGFGIKNFLGNVQYTYLSRQYTDAENTLIAEPGDSREGVIGEIPAYGILDLSLSYKYKNWKLETGVNNLLDEVYFTRRATGYPGPGIIPSDPRSYYVTLQFRFSKD